MEGCSGALGQKVGLKTNFQGNDYRAEGLKGKAANIPLLRDGEIWKRQRSQRSWRQGDGPLEEFSFLFKGHSTMSIEPSIMLRHGHSTLQSGAHLRRTLRHAWWGFSLHGGGFGLHAHGAPIVFMENPREFSLALPSSAAVPNNRIRSPRLDAFSP